MTTDSNEDRFLEWFADQGHQMLERKLYLGELAYFHFTADVELIDGRRAGSFGSDPDRKVAALKCAAEAIERQTMAKFFRKHADEFPKAFRNSNGWAIHFDADKAKASALSEATERHLLLKSYLTYGWRGFNPFLTMPAVDMNLTLLTSRMTASGHVAGMVLAQSPLYPGVSTGFSEGDLNDVNEGSFWQRAIFEAVDKILKLNGRPLPSDGGSWIKKSIAHDLTNRFDPAVLPSEFLPTVESELGTPEARVFDLKVELGLDFPLFAAFVSGTKLIPLFAKSDLDEEAEVYLYKILRENDLADVSLPERHPIT